ncbi:MAG: hypothetical protein R2856_33040 [Caldilineaceae bacterium]
MALLEWIVRLWVGTQLALALDATSLGDRFVVLAVSVVYRGCGIPVAWVVLPAGQKGAWRKEWLRLLRLLRPAVPPEWTVIVLADRGLYAGWLYRRIVRLHWHPFLRINNGAKFRPAGCAHWYGLKELVGTVGHQWQGRGSCFKDPVRRLECTLLAWWAPANEDPWFILTDLAPTDSAVTWYGPCTWCEQGSSTSAAAGNGTCMHHPERAARLWLAMSVATLWMVSVGSDLECGANLDDPDIPDLHHLLDIASNAISAFCAGASLASVKAIASPLFTSRNNCFQNPGSPLSHPPPSLTFRSCQHEKSTPERHFPLPLNHPPPRIHVGGGAIFFTYVFAPSDLRVSCICLSRRSFGFWTRLTCPGDQ